MVYIPKHAKQACDFTSQSEASDIAHSPQAPIPTSHRMKSNMHHEQAFCNELAPVTEVRGGGFFSEDGSVTSRRSLLAGGLAAFVAGALTTKPSLAHAVEDNVASRNELAQLAYEVANLSYDVSGFSSSLSSFDSRLSQAEQDVEGFTNCADKFPVKNGDIADNSISMGKLTDQAKADIISGISVRHFNNYDRGADNTGLICPAQGSLTGFYVPELTLLVITRYYKPYGISDGSWLSGETGYRLPTYVPRVTENVTFAPYGVIDFDQNGVYQDWHGFGVNPQGYVGGIGESGKGEGRVLVGNIITFLRPYVAVG